jgi:hypothetical protein
VSLVGNFSSVSIILILIADEVQLAGFDLVSQTPVLERFLAAVGANLLPSISRGGGPAELVEGLLLVGRGDPSVSPSDCHLPCKCRGGD